MLLEVGVRVVMAVALVMAVVVLALFPLLLLLMLLWRKRCVEIITRAFPVAALVRYRLLHLVANIVVMERVVVLSAIMLACHGSVVFWLPMPMMAPPLLMLLQLLQLLSGVARPRGPAAPFCGSDGD